MTEDKKSELEASGTLKKGVALEVCAELVNEQISGSIRFEHDKYKVIIYFLDGEIVFAVSNSKSHRIFQLLISEGAVSQEVIVGIDGFTNDLHLGNQLVEAGHVSRSMMDSIFAAQISVILQTVWTWESGTWEFSPLARVKEEINFRVNFTTLVKKKIGEYTQDEIVARFNTLSEKFVLRKTEVDSIENCGSPQEAFLISRIGSVAKTIEEIRSMSALPNEELYPSLYGLWLSGTLKRLNWKSHFPEGSLEKLSGTHFSLKRTATSYVEEQKKIEEIRIAEKAKLEEEKLALSDDKAKNSNEISLEEYLARVEKAATHYELFNLKPESTVSEIKRVYFYYAKNFHPDILLRDKELHEQKVIQHAFTEIARAYEVLKDPDSRELYDFKMRKVLESAQNASELPAEIDHRGQKNSMLGEAEFKKGHELFLGGKINEAIPYFERAVRYDDGVARYHAFLGKALAMGQKQKHRAESELLRACSMDERSESFRIMLAEVYIEFRLLARARGELQRLLDRSPSNSEARRLFESLNL